MRLLQQEELTFIEEKLWIQFPFLNLPATDFIALSVYNFLSLNQLFSKKKKKIIKDKISRQFTPPLFLLSFHTNYVTFPALITSLLSLSLSLEVKSLILYPLNLRQTINHNASWKVQLKVFCGNPLQVFEFLFTGFGEG